MAEHFLFVPPREGVAFAAVFGPMTWSEASKLNARIGLDGWIIRPRDKETFDEYLEMFDD
jgi:hypothetical protein